MEMEPVMEIVEKRFAFQRRIGYTFESQELLGRALTHRAFSSGRDRDNNERLEFLGDRVLELVAVERLMVECPGWEPGRLSPVLNEMLANERLAKVARRLGLDQIVLVNVEELRQSTRVLADALEAVIGAVWEETRDLGVLAEVCGNMGVI